MERVQKESADSDSAKSRRTATGAQPINSPLFGIANAINNSPVMAAQRQKLQGLFGDAAQLRAEVEPLQAFGDSAQLKAAAAAKPNETGLPNNLKAGIESLAGMSMGNVRGHYNSSQPAQLNVHAYAQGTNIYVAPGQEKHLPHEAWHVVQQVQGRIQPTMQVKDGVPVNDDTELEHEVDMMGGQSVRHLAAGSSSVMPMKGAPVIQGIFEDENGEPITNLPEEKLKLTETITIPPEFIEKMGDIYDEVKVRMAWKSLVKESYESQEGHFCIGEGWEDFLVQEMLWGNFQRIKNTLEEPLNSENSGIRDNLLNNKYEEDSEEVRKKIGELGNMSLERLCRIATLKQGELVKFTFTVTELKAAPKLAKVCEKFNNEWQKIQSSIQKESNFLLKDKDKYKDAWAGIKETAEYVLETYPPDKNAYVGLGA
ncbi:MAG: eCIS core domain-containing protein, partial [Burkholderiales bacterium]